MGFQRSTRTKDDVTIGTEDRLTGMMHVQMILKTVDTSKALGTLMTKFGRCLLLFHVVPFFERIESIQCGLEEENKNNRLHHPLSFSVCSTRRTCLISSRWFSTDDKVLLLVSNENRRLKRTGDFSGCSGAFSSATARLVAADEHVFMMIKILTRINHLQRQCWTRKKSKQQPD